MQAKSVYDVLLGRRGLQQFEFIPSTIHGLLRFQTDHGTTTIIGSKTRPQEKDDGTSTGKALVTVGAQRNPPMVKEGHDRDPLPEETNMTMPRSDFWMFFPSKREMMNIMTIISEKNSGRAIPSIQEDLVSEKEGEDHPKTNECANCVLAISSYSRWEHNKHNPDSITIAKVGNEKDGLGRSETTGIGSRPAKVGKE